MMLSMQASASSHHQILAVSRQVSEPTSDNTVLQTEPHVGIWVLNGAAVS